MASSWLIEYSGNSERAKTSDMTKLVAMSTPRPIAPLDGRSFRRACTGGGR
jgi:hypothetical protein